MSIGCVKKLKESKSSAETLKVLKGGVPKETRNGKMLGFFPTPSLRKEIEQLAERENRSLSSVCYLLVLKGLDEYEKDHDLRSPRSLPLKRSTKNT